MTTGSSLHDVAASLAFASEVEESVQEMLKAASARIATLSQQVNALVAGEGPFEATTAQITALKQTVEVLETRRVKIEEVLNG